MMPRFILKAICLALLLQVPAFAAERGASFPMWEFEEPAIVPVTIGGKARLFVVDSGCTTHVFHTSLRSAIGEPSGTHGVNVGGDQLQVEYFECPEALFGGVWLSTDAPVVCRDLETLRSALGRDIEGIIGLAQFYANIIQFDFDKRQITFLPGDAQPTADWGVAVDVVETSGGIPAVEAIVGGTVRQYSDLDTGAMGSIHLDTKAFEELLAKKAIKLRDDTRIAMLHAVKDVRKGTVSELKVGDFTHRNLTVTESHGSQIGMRYLCRYRVTFDIGHGKVYFAKGAQFERDDWAPTLGVGVLRHKGKPVVVSTVPNSPAERAGIRAGDELVVVAGRDATNSPNAEIMGLWRQQALAEGNVALTLKRNGETIAVICKCPRSRAEEEVMATR